MSKKTLFTILCLCIFLGFSSLAYSQDKAADDVRTKIETYYTAFGNGDWQSVVTMMHPEALESFKSTFVGIFKSLPEGANRTQGLQLLFNVDSLSQFEILSPKEIFSSLMTNMLAINPGLFDMMKNMSVEYIGSVTEGEDLLHCVIRTKLAAEGKEMASVQVMSFKKYEGKWMALLTGDLESIGQMFQQIAP